MKNSLMEYIILYVVVGCVILMLAAIARISVVAMGFDDFTTFIVFIVFIAVQVGIYFSIHMIIQNFMLPLIIKGLSKIPYYKHKIEERQVSLTGKEENPDAPELASYEDFRNEQLQNKIKDKEKEQNIVLNYTRKSFVLYLSDEHLNVLCQNIQIYIHHADLAELKPVRVKELTAIDLRHFGWNIWNFFKPRNQMDIAEFLKNVFPDIFKDTEVESIKRHLKDDELKGVIKIQEKLDK